MSMTIHSLSNCIRSSLVHDVVNPISSGHLGHAGFSETQTATVGDLAAATVGRSSKQRELGFPHDVIRVTLIPACFAAFPI